MTQKFIVNADHRVHRLELINAVIEVHAAPGQAGRFYCTHPSLGCSRSYSLGPAKSIRAFLDEHAYGASDIKEAPDYSPDDLRAAFAQGYQDGAANKSADPVDLMGDALQAYADGFHEGLTESRQKYGATVCDRRGRVLYKSQPHTSREDAALECFAARPRARSVMTERLGTGGQWAGFDIQWSDRFYTLRAVYLAQGANGLPDSLQLEAFNYANPFGKAGQP